MTGDRRSAWFPLALLGFLLLGAAAWQISLSGDGSGGWFAYAPVPGSGEQLSAPRSETNGSATLYAFATSGSFGYVNHPPVTRRAELWPVILVLALLATLAWYGFRARRTGEPVRPVRLALTAVAGLVILAAPSMLAVRVAATDGRFLVTAVGLPLLAIGAVAGAWAWFRIGPGRRFAAVACAVCLALAACAFTAAFPGPAIGPASAALGLAALAWYTRSVETTIAAVLFLVAALLLSSGTALGLVVPGAVLLACAFATLLRRPA